MLPVSALILLRLAHIVLGAFWVGAMIFMAVFFIPTVRSVPNGGAVMQHMMIVRKLSAWLGAAATVAVLSGLALYWNASMGFSPAWLGSGPGRMFGAGGVLAIIALILGGSINSRGVVRLQRISALIQAGGGLPTPAQSAEIERQQHRMALSTRVIAVLVVLATMAMASARYVG